MKIYLLSEGGWELFDVERESEELKNRHISIGEGASIPRYRGFYFALAISF